MRTEITTLNKSLNHLEFIVTRQNPHPIDDGCVANMVVDVVNEFKANHGGCLEVHRDPSDECRLRIFDHTREPGRWENYQPMTRNGLAISFDGALALAALLHGEGLTLASTPAT